MAEPLIIGNNLIEVASCASTNDLLRVIIENSFQAEGTVLFTLHQTAGRGQIGTKWHSPPGDSLTFSLWLKPKFLHPTRHFFLNMAISNAIIQFMQQNISPLSRIKWPNDLYIGNKKSGGILIENTLNQHQISGSIIGIGINLNQLEFPVELPNPVSWKQITGNTYEPKKVLMMLLPYLDAWYHKLRVEAYQQIKKEYVRYLHGFNTTLKYEDASGIFNGMIHGVDETGCLMLTKETGEKCKYKLKEIRFVFDGI